MVIENRVGSYSDKGHGRIYWSSNENRGPSPLDLVRTAAQTFGQFFSPALEKLRVVERGMLSEIVDRVPEDWMTPVAREFALALMCYNLQQLQNLLS